MNIKSNISLKPFNTFGIDVNARYFIDIYSENELVEFISIRDKKLPLLVLGGGSNLLFTGDFIGYVLKLNNKGWKTVKETGEHVFVKVSAGEIWDNFVRICLKNNWGGVENLVLIPGSVGASPIQNIGAYGVELKDVFYELEAIDIESGESLVFSKDDCGFEYRYSIFKGAYKNKYVIVSVTFVLDKIHQYKVDYGDIRAEIDGFSDKSISIQNVAKAVENLRRRKLPDPEITGNAGSFFKNPSITKDNFDKIKTEFPEIVSYSNPDGTKKLAAGWLIEKCGWKGVYVGNAGVHEKQALVIINKGNASGSEILLLANEIQKSVFKTFGINLEFEVNII